MGQNGLKMGSIHPFVHSKWPKSTFEHARRRGRGVLWLWAQCRRPVCSLAAVAVLLSLQLAVAHERDRC